MPLRYLSLAAILLPAAHAVAGDFYAGATIGVSIYDSTADTGAGVELSLDDPIPIDGLTFKSEETTWGAFIGWQAKDWLALELGYDDLGNTGWSGNILPTGGGANIPSTAALDVEEWWLGARFRKDLGSGFSANWSVAVSRAEFDVAGRSFILVGIFPPGVITTIERSWIPVESETGYVWGFGFEWAMNEHVAIDLGYRRHDARVLDVDTVTLRVVLTP